MIHTNYTNLLAFAGRVKILLFLICMILGGFSFAATVTWTNGGGDGRWSNGRNWSSGSVPGATDDVLFDGTSHANATMYRNATINNLTFDAAYNGTLQQNWYNLTLNGSFSSAKKSQYSVVNYAAGEGVIHFTGNATFSGPVSLGSIEVGDTLTLLNDLTLDGDLSTVYAPSSYGAKGTIIGNTGTEKLIFKSRNGGFSRSAYAAPTMEIENLEINQEQFYYINGPVKILKNLWIKNAGSFSGLFEVSGDVHVEENWIWGGVEIKMVGSQNARITSQYANGINGLEILVAKDNSSAKVSLENSLYLDEAIRVENGMFELSPGVELNPNEGVEVRGGGIFIANGEVSTRVDVGGGGTLAGSGKISGFVSIGEGGILAPGSSSGCLTISNLYFWGYSFGTKPTLRMDIAGGTACSLHDKLIVENNVQFNRDAILDLQITGTFTSLTLIENDGTLPVGGSYRFQGLPEGATITAGGVDYAISYVGGDGNDITLSPNAKPDCSNAAIANQLAGANCIATISGADVTGVTDADNDPLTISVSPTTLGLGANTVSVSADDGKGGTCSTSITVTVTSPPPPALSEQNCNGCGEIRFNFCQNGPAYDLEQELQANSTREANAPLHWYTDLNGNQGSPMGSAPAVNTANKGKRYYWVTQANTNCGIESPATRVRVMVKKEFVPVWSAFPTSGCGNGAAQLDLAQYVSDPGNKATAFTFYTQNPKTNPTATPLGSVQAVQGVVKAGESMIVTLNPNTPTYWVQATVPNGCGGVAAATISMPTQQATLNPINSHTVTAGDPVNISFSGQHVSHIVWFDLPLFANPNIGIMGSMGLGNLAFTAHNSGSSDLVATIRVIAYNGSCAGQVQDFTITVRPAPASRQGQINELLLTGNLLANGDALLTWQIIYDQALLQFDIEKETGENEWTKIGNVLSQGNGSYAFRDQDFMGEINRYRLKLVHADGRIVWSQVIEIHANVLANDPFVVYPNPTTDRFIIGQKGGSSLVTSDVFQWKVSDMMGKVLLTGSLQQAETTVSLGSLPAGVYTVMILSEDQKYVHRIVKK